jgi:hypothetical protein
MQRTLIAGIAMMLLITPGVNAEDPKPNDKTMGAKPPDNATILFSGENLDAWVKPDGKSPAEWPVSGNKFEVGRGNIMSKPTFGDQLVHLEFNVPYMPEARGQGRGNSGVYLAGAYELQILDSYGLKPQTNDCAAIYQQHAPSVNACKPPLQWQTYDIAFKKAKIKDGKVVEKARITVMHNGIVVIDDKEITATPGGLHTKEGEDGPLWLQDHGNAVQFRNIWIAPLPGINFDLSKSKVTGVESAKEPQKDK